MTRYYAIFECNPACPYWGKTPSFETSKEVHEWIDEAKKPPDEIVSYDLYQHDDEEVLVSKHVVDE